MIKIDDKGFKIPDDFIFGVATAAYQIEGAVDIDGRGPSIWDAFSHTKGNIVNDDNGDIACDHYRLWKNDLDLINQLGVDAYRFSFSWSRIMANGRGPANAKGLAFYDKLIDGCLERGLQPFATLYHWDLPLALFGNGGWNNRDTAYAFAAYAELVVDNFGDRLASISTFNEPWCSAMLGHLYGIHAPGLTDLPTAIKAVHHQHLAHGLAVQKIKQHQPNLETGIVLNLQSIYPASDKEDDVAASVRHDIFHNKIYLDPVFNGQYPPEFISELGHMLPTSWENDLADINQSLDFWGLNYYTPTRVLNDSDGAAEYPRSITAAASQTVDKTDIGWEINPTAFYDLFKNVYKEYALPKCYITENGACFNDEPENGKVSDERRTKYLKEHIEAVALAAQDDIPIAGYFAWSLMDNFEWAEGYTMRFGLVHVNYTTQERTIKDSGHWFSELVSNRP